MNRENLAAVCMLLVGSCAFLCEWIAMPGTRAQGQGNDLPLKDRFLQEAPGRWDEYTQRAKALQGTFSFHMQARGSGRSDEAQNTYEMKTNAKGKLLRTSMERTIDGKTHSQRFGVIGVNPNYAFFLEQKTKSSPWVVTELVDLRTNSLPPRAERDFDIFERDIIELVRIGSMPLVELIRKPEFHVVRCQKLPQEREELAEVVFDCPQKVKGQFNGVQGGTLLLDPRRFWCLRSYEVQEKFPGGRGTVKFQVLELGETDQGWPVPKRVVREGNFISDPEGRRTEDHWRLQYDVGVPRRLPSDEEFTLSAFGLPEPPWLGERRPTAWYLWAAALGLFCLGLAALLRWRVGRAQ